MSSPLTVNGELINFSFSVYRGYILHNMKNEMLAGLDVVSSVKWRGTVFMFSTSSFMHNVYIFKILYIVHSHDAERTAFANVSYPRTSTFRMFTTFFPEKLCIEAQAKIVPLDWTLTSLPY